MPRWSWWSLLRVDAPHDLVARRSIDTSKVTTSTLTGSTVIDAEHRAASTAVTSLVENGDGPRVVLAARVAAGVVVKWSPILRRPRVVCPVGIGPAACVARDRAVPWVRGLPDRDWVPRAPADLQVRVGPQPHVDAPAAR